MRSNISQPPTRPAYERSNQGGIALLDWRAAGQRRYLRDILCPRPDTFTSPLTGAESPGSCRSRGGHGEKNKKLQPWAERGCHDEPR
jgi:hypothetical protein